MNHAPRYEALVNFLISYQDIWRNEIMLLYPRPLAPYPLAWIEELEAINAPEVNWNLLMGKGWDKLSPDLSRFHQELTELSLFPKAKPTAAFPTRSQSWIHIIPKKQHEIERLAPHIYDFMQSAKLKKIVDIGGGQGHLAQSMAHHYELDVTSLDMDESLQTLGLRWQEFKWPESKHPVTFRKHKITRQDEEFARLLDSSTLTTGLHTCGGLAVAHLEASLLARAHVLNMPCCYHKLELQDCNLSQNAKQKPLAWEQFSLTLASGAHRKVTLNDVEFRNQVKRYRYTLHFFLVQEFGMHEQVKLGNCEEKLYYGPFADYCRAQLAILNLETQLSDESLESFFQTKQHQELISKMLAAGVIRESFGRALEAAVITDRALWLEEQNYKASIYEIFNPEISPRNIVLEAKPI
ncbi:MAG: SAM-dependent methyltransferase [Bacteriovoracaceae bacterium]|nr:SAM-dependent methyltransferase [Bacteriovoracaceae bacterium]